MTALLIEAFKSTNLRVLAVVIHRHRLPEFNSALCFVDCGVLFIADPKSVVAIVVVPASAYFALTNGPDARFLSARYVILNGRTVAEEEDAEQREENEWPP